MVLSSFPVTRYFIFRRGKRLDRVANSGVLILKYSDQDVYVCNLKSGIRCPFLIAISSANTRALFTAPMFSIIPSLLISVSTSKICMPVTKRSSLNTTQFYSLHHPTLVANIFADRRDLLLRGSRHGGRGQGQCRHELGTLMTLPDFSFWPIYLAGNVCFPRETKS